VKKMKPKRRVQDTFFGKFLFDLAVPKEHPLRLLRDLIDWDAVRKVLPKKDYAPTGRRAVDPIIHVKLLILEFLENQSDVKVVQNAQTDLAMRYFLDLPVPVVIPDDTTLCKFRKWLGVEGVERLAEEILIQIRKAGYARDTETVVIDSTDQQSNTAPLSARELIRRLLDKVFCRAEACEERGISSKGLASLKGPRLRHETWKTTHDQRRKDGSLTKAERFTQTVHHAERCLTEFQTFLAQIKRTTPDILNESSFRDLSSSLTLLEQVLEETVDRSPPTTQEEKKNTAAPNKETPGPSLETTTASKSEPASAEAGQSSVENVEEPLKRKRKGRKILSHVDPEARSGAKSARKKFVGYKLHALMTEDRFLTAVTTSSGNMHDAYAVFALLHEHTAKIGHYPDVLGMDKAYGGGWLRRELHLLDIQDAVALKAPRQTGFFPTDIFHYDPEKEQVTCPAGYVTTRWSFAADQATRVFRFGKRCCAGCELRAQCTANRTGRTISITPYWEELEQARLFNTSGDYEKARRLRWGEEAKFGEAKRYHGLGRCRYLGLARTHLQNLLTCIALNLKRFLKLDTAKQPFWAVAPA